MSNVKSKPTPTNFPLQTNVALLRKTRPTKSGIHLVPHTSLKRIRFDLSPSKPTASPRFPAALRAFNVLWDRKPPAHGALDSGATSHFLPTSYKGTHHQTTTPADGILVQCANNTTMTSVATDRLNLQSLPTAARECHKFNHMPTPLLSVKTFCDN